MLKRFFKRMLVYGILIVILAALAGGGYLWFSLPRSSGTYSLDGLSGPIDITRDSAGVPHIFAQSDNDAFFALGWVHAQDRLWQMEMNRRVGAGRLSEILGEKTLKIDQFLRTLGVRRAAQEAWTHLKPRTRTLFEHYIAGVNAWIQEVPVLPIEFQLLQFEPEPWTPVDSLVWAKLMAWDLGGDYSQELLRVRLEELLGPQRTRELLPQYPEEGPSILAGLSSSSVEELLTLDSFLQDQLGLRGIDVGSNNWVVSGKWTASGLPLLANDPHLGTRIPSIWYLVELQGPTLHVTGATFPGLPGVPIGHNDQIAWGVTNMGPDVQDLYRERINPDQPNQYLVNGTWNRMTLTEEPILVKGRDQPFLWAARATRHGPLISDVTETAEPLALRWTALDPDDTTIDAFTDILWAENWTEFRDALRQYVAPSQNFVYADRQGNIGYIAPGRIPIRSQGKGWTPAPGWSNDYEWTDWIPFDQLPQAYNPPEGWVVTANNKVVSDLYPYHLSNNWMPPYRAERIRELLQERLQAGKKLTVDDMARIQGDQHNALIPKLLPLLLQTPAASEQDQQALALLKEWNGDLSRDSVAASLFEAWLSHLTAVLLEDEVGPRLYEELARRNHEVFLVNLLTDPEQGRFWCDHRKTTPRETCTDMLQQALHQALAELENRLGRDLQEWRWGALHQTQYPHTPFSEVPYLKPFFHRSIENGGDRNTVNVASYKPHERYAQHWGPSYRQIIDLSDWNTSRFMHTTGQSGNVLSPHYDDLIEPHRNVEYLPMTFGREATSGNTQTLVPQ